MIPARDAVKKIKLTAIEESEVQRLGGQIVASIRDGDTFKDGTPFRSEVAAGKDDKERASTWRVVCALQRRFQSDGWTVIIEKKEATVERVVGDEEVDAYGVSKSGKPVEIVKELITTDYVLWFAVDGSRQVQVPVEVKTDAKAPNILETMQALNTPAPRIKTATNPVLSVLLGTYNRRELLMTAVESVRMSAGSIPLEVVVADGGSTDGSREWLAAQPDVVLVGFRHLGGAVHAFNAAFAVSRGAFVCNLNDDMTVVGDALAQGVRALQNYPKCGQVAFAFKGEGEEWTVNEIAPGKHYANFGITRREVADKIAYIQGGFWNASCYHTYAGDVETSAWCWRLGMSVDPLMSARVIDIRHSDALREKNQARFAVDTKRMYTRWPHAALDPDGPEPRVTPEELERYRRVKEGHWTLAAPVETDVLVEMATLCGLPEPGEERRLRKIAPLVRALDPKDGFPHAVEKLGTERVLHISLCTDADPQVGLVNALCKFGQYSEVRWHEHDFPTRRRLILEAAKDIHPTLIFAQLQVNGAIDEKLLRDLRPLCDPSCVFVSWNGDIADVNSPYSVDWFVPVGRLFDVVLHSSMSHVKSLRAAGCHHAARMDIGYDPVQYHSPGPEDALHHVGFPEVAVKHIYDVVFLGSRYSNESPFAQTYRWKSGEKAHDGDLRDAVVLAMHEAFGERFGLFGRGWEKLTGRKEQVVPLAGAHEVYWRSRIGLSISLDNKLEMYSSDRLHRILGCGTLALVKAFPGMDVFGLKHGENCLVWNTVEEAVTLAKDAITMTAGGMLSYEAGQIAAAGAKLAQEHHTWDVRMHELATYVEAVRSSR